MKLLRYCCKKKLTISILYMIVFFFQNTSIANTITVKVLVKEPLPCVINNNNIINVKFDDILAEEIDGRKKIQKIDYSVECIDNPSNLMKIMISGTPTSFNRNALKTNMEGLGVAILVNGEDFAINSWKNFTYPNLPLLEAVPVKDSQKIISGGNFYTGGTLIVSYQ